MTGRRLYFRYLKTGTEGLIELYEKNAPVTCAAIWQALAKPIRIRVIHAMYAGPEVFGDLPAEARIAELSSIPPENQSIMPGKGEMVWFPQQRGLMRGMADEALILALFYDHGGRTFGPTGWVPENVLGIMRDGIDAVAEECRDIRWTGAKDVEIGRHER